MMNTKRQFQAIRGRIILVLLFIGSSNISYSQSYGSYIVGEWKSVNIETVKGDTVNLLGIRYTTRSELEFTAKMVTDELGEKSSYEIENNLLLIGNRLYIIEKITKASMILVNYDPSNPKDPLAKRIYYERKNSHI